MRFDTSILKEVKEACPHEVWAVAVVAEGLILWPFFTPDREQAERAAKRYTKRKGILGILVGPLKVSGNLDS